MASPIPDQPGVLIRDPLRYTDVVVVVPPPLVPFLSFFNGTQTLLELKAALVRATGDVSAASFADALQEKLSHHGFLEDEVFAALREQKERAFAEEGVRRAVFAGSAYPGTAASLAKTLGAYLDSGAAESPALPKSLVGIAAPHVSPEGGPDVYGAAYRALAPDLKGRTFIVLGTSHYGFPERFGLTRKPFETPLGNVRVDVSSVAALSKAAPDAVTLEDYAYAAEHSIEFQVVFLQQVLGSDLEILPILCGPLLPRDGGLGGPEVEAFVEALRELFLRDRERFFFVLGVDLAHIGRRYGDNFEAASGEGFMKEVEQDDRRRLARILEGDAEGFVKLLGPEDRLRWCGTSPLYTLLRTVPGISGDLLRYAQWNIDPQSVVSFCALAFFCG